MGVLVPPGNSFTYIYQARQIIESVVDIFGYNSLGYHLLIDQPPVVATGQHETISAVCP